MPNKVYTNSETKIVFVDPTVASGADYVTFTPAALSAGDAWLSDPRDLGAFPRSTLFRWRAKCTLDGQAHVGDTIEIYWMGFDDPAELGSATGLLFGADGNLDSGNQWLAQGTYFGTNDERRENLQWLGAITVDRGESGVITFTNSGLCQLFSRYGAVTFFNNTSAGTASQADGSAFSLTPMPDEIE